jgi:hypothetical protein
LSNGNVAVTVGRLDHGLEGAADGRSLTVTARPAGSVEHDHVHPAAGQLVGGMQPWIKQIGE